MMTKEASESEKWVNALRDLGVPMTEENSVTRYTWSNPSKAKPPSPKNQKKKKGEDSHKRKNSVLVSGSAALGMVKASDITLKTEDVEFTNEKIGSGGAG